MTGPRRSGWTLSFTALVGMAGLGAPTLASGGPAAASEPAAIQAPAGPGAAANPGIATVEATRGRVTVIRLGRSQPAALSMPLQMDDIVVTKRGRATVRFGSDGALLRIGPGSRVQINESATERDVTLFFGKVWAHVVRWKERTTRFRTSGTIAAIRGTELSVGVEVDGDQTRVAVLEGTVETENDTGSLTLTGGQVAVSTKGAAPSLSARVQPRDAVQWALYYLPVFHGRPGELGQGQEWQGNVQESAEAFLKGDLGDALESLDSVAVEGIRDAGFFSYRASLLLAAGSVEDAARDIDQALKLAPDDSDALALQTVIAVANNRNDEALRTAEKAVAADSGSATAQVALSYARQARFDLEGARESLETAVTLAPDDALAWARLAEIRSSLGHRGEALDAAQKAVDLEPNLSRTQTVLGYAHLTRVQTTEAREAFQKAIALDPDDPLPRLGLGLARIRDGDLAEGSQDIEVAVSLDPGQALVRAYLGKAYFEAKRIGLDEREYDVAKESDPLDPTAWFYDAIAKQTTNRPVEALQSLQKAIELNDNRAIYRSRLMLDEDLAARSASLGRVFSDLGFQSLALVEGWTSVNTDPGNFSAHRLLADSYAALPRHEIARVSELFQSQMLQPLNTTPIQPRLGESNLFLISSQGPAALAFNEFNPLFNRNQINAQGSFLFGGGTCGLDESLGLCPESVDDTLAGEGIVSGVFNKLSFSAGYSGFQTDGFRENNKQEDQIANAFVQLELSPSTSIQAEARHRKLESGDLGLRFFEDDFSPLEAQTTDGTSVRVGLRQDFGPGVTFLASYMHSDSDTEFALPDPFSGFNFSLDLKEKADSLEGQLLYLSPRLKIVGGAGYFDIDSDETDVFELDDPDFGFTETVTSDRRIKHANLYAYAYVPLPSDLTLTLGVSGDSFEESGEAFSEFEIPGLPPDERVPIEADVLGTRDQFNPKGGITWRLESGTTLRAAGFRTLKRTLITDQTLEPTQVAGFNQFFDDPTGTEAWVYGGAIDQKFGTRVFGGVQITHRDLTIPQILFEDGVDVSVTENDGSEDMARAYLFAAPHPWLTFGAEYEYEDFELDRMLFFPFSKVQTHRVPLSARFFHPSGFGAFLGLTYLDQEGEFLAFNEMGEQDFVPGDKSFWVVDAALRYRLPKRYGFLAIGVNNLTDERSTYQATDSRNLRIRPGRVFFASVVVAFP